MHHLVGSVRVKQWGTIELNNEGECGGVTLKKCLYIPGMRINMFSGQKAREAGWSYTCSGKDGGIIPVYKKSGQQVCTLKETSTGRKTLICTPVRHQQLSEGESVVAAVKINLLHTKLGHANERVLKNLAREHLVRGLEGGISGVLQI